MSARAGQRPRRAPRREAHAGASPVGPLLPRGRELPAETRATNTVPPPDLPARPIDIPANLLRESLPLPEVSEPEVVRHLVPGSVGGEQNLHVRIVPERLLGL